MEPGECQPEQVQVMILGTFHMEYQESIDILDPTRQGEIERLVDELAEFAPDKVTVEYPYERNDELNEGYRRYLELPAHSLAWTNEIAQIGFRLARRLGHDSVYAVDVPMKLWHDSIRVFDERFPNARSSLRRQWNVRYPDNRYAPRPDPDSVYPLMERLRPWNVDAAPSIPEFGRFLPLVEGDVYAGALKLRPWFDRNMRIVQNLFRVLDPGEDDRLFMVVGGSHVRVLRQILDLTPQLCALSALPAIDAAGGD